MEFRGTFYLLQVAKLQSFQSNQSPSAIHRRLLPSGQAAGTGTGGVHLFYHIGKQTSLTHQGSVFYGYAASIYAGI